MKALELIIYPKLEPPRTGAEIMPYREQWQREHALLQTKHLTGAELAAEYWRLRLKVCASGNGDMTARGHLCTEWQAAHDELDTMTRFMELPHYDEVAQ